MTEYNGWTNYETWAVGLYLDGNYTGEGTYLEVLDIVRENAPEGVYQVAEALEDYVDINVTERDDEPIAGLALDMLRAALSEVNWRELAEAKLSEIAEES